MARDAQDVKGKGKELEESPQDELLFDDAELDRIFNQEASLVSREAEARALARTDTGGAAWLAY